MADDFRELEDFNVGADAPTAALPDPWADIAAENAAHARETGSTWDLSIRERAAQLAAKNGTSTDVEEGKLLAKYMLRIANVVRQYAVIDGTHEVNIGMLKQRIADMQAELAAAEYARAQCPRIVTELNQRDAMMVRDYMETAPQFQDSKRKSWGTPFGKLARRTKTTKDAFLRADTDTVDALLVDAYDGTEFVKTDKKPLWGEIKKRLSRRDDGTIIDAETGQIIPEAAVQYRAGSSEEHYYIEVGGYKIDLSEASISGAGNSDDDGGDPDDADDFFGPGGQYDTERDPDAGGS